MHRFMFLLLALLMSACSSDGTGPDGGDGIPGNYSLQTIGGVKLPAVYSEGSGYKSEVISHIWNLTSDGRFTVEERYRTTRTGRAPTEERETSSGTWEAAGTTILFRDGPDRNEGILGKGMFTIRVNGKDWVFKK